MNEAVRERHDRGLGREFSYAWRKSYIFGRVSECLGEFLSAWERVWMLETDPRCLEEALIA